MRPPVRSIALLVISALVWVYSVPTPAEAMLVPVTAYQTNRSRDVQTIEKTLASQVVRQRLHTLGLSDDEIQSRLSRLSDRQVHQLASQIRALNPAGDGWIVGILVIVLLVLLIIYLVKRI